MLLLMFDTGLRASKLIAIPLGDVDLEGGMLRARDKGRRDHAPQLIADQFEVRQARDQSQSGRGLPGQPVLWQMDRCDASTGVGRDAVPLLRGASPSQL